VEGYKEDGTGELFSLNLEVNHLARVQCQLEEKSVHELFLGHFSDETFSAGQMMVCKMGNIWIKFTVLECLKADMEDERGYKEVAYGEISNRTDIQYTPYLNNQRLVWKAMNKKFKMLGPNFDALEMGVGGLAKQFEKIFRTAFASRFVPPTLQKELGVTHIKGMLLYGPPGTGKTTIARAIGSLLTERPAKIVNGPEILNRFVGASEENVRALFQDARDDQEAHEDDPENCDLHIIIFDEIDAICKSRGSTGGGTGVGDTVVNQLLTMIDGVDALNNILVIGMTNRMDLLDRALLRAGRLEVKIEIGLPNEDGREEIFRIHTKEIAANNRLGEDVDMRELAELTKNYSGAEIEAVVRSARQFSFVQLFDSKTMSIHEDRETRVCVIREHFLKGIQDNKPDLGVAEEELTRALDGGFHVYGDEFQEVFEDALELLKPVQGSRTLTTRLSLLLQGPTGCGKTALAAKLSEEANFPFVQLISADSLVSLTEQSRVQRINTVFADAYKSEQSCVIIDDIHRLLGYSAVGPRFSSHVLTVIETLCRAKPPHGRSIAIIGICPPRVADQLDLYEVFDRVFDVPLIRSSNAIKTYLKAANCNVQAIELETISCLFEDKEVGVKTLQMVTDKAKNVENNDEITVQSFENAMRLYGL